MPFNAPQPTRTSQTPTHTPTTARAIAAHGTITRACEGRARVAVIPYRVAIPARAANAHAYASAHSACHAHAHTAPPTYAYARAQKPRRMAAIPVIAAEGVHVPAYAGCISRLLAPKVARPSRRQGRRFSSTRRQAVAFRNSVSQPTPPQGTPAPAKDPRRHGLSNSVAPAARKRSASAATGAIARRRAQPQSTGKPPGAPPGAVALRTAPQAPYGVSLRRDEKSKPSCRCTRAPACRGNPSTTALAPAPSAGRSSCQSIRAA